MASNPIKRNGYWQVRWTYLGRSQQFKAVELAHAQALSDWVTALGNRIDQDDPLITKGKAYLHGIAEATQVIADGRTYRYAMEEFLANTIRKPQSAQQHRYTLTGHLADWADRPVASFTESELNRKFREIVASGLSSSSAYHVMAKAKAVLRYARAKGWTEFSVTDTSKLLVFNGGTAKPETPRPALTMTEFRQFRERATTQQDRDALTFWVSVGPRIAEFCGFVVGDVDLARGILTFRAQIEDGKRVKSLKGARNGKRAEQHVAIDDTVAALLAPYVEGRDRDAPLFARPDSKFGHDEHWTPEWWRARVWAPIKMKMIEAGLLGRFSDAELGLITPHCLRHSMATWLAPHVHPTILMDRMRHTNIATTMKYYRDRDDAALAVERAAASAMMARLALGEPDNGGGLAAVA